VQAGVNYTYAVAKGSSSSQQERYSGAFDVVGTQSLRFLPLNFDQRHTANANMSVNFDAQEGPFGFLPVVFENTAATVLAQYGSGLPFTFNPARARYVAEPNNARIAANVTVDLLIEKEFRVDPIRLTVFADIRNALWRKNIRSVYSATGTPTNSGSDLSTATPDYMQDPTNYFAPRTIYLGLTIAY
jgi:hypothetical protein